MKNASISTPPIVADAGDLHPKDGNGGNANDNKHPTRLINSMTYWEKAMGKSIELDDNESLFGPRNLVPPYRRKSNRQQVRTPGGERGGLKVDIIKQVDLLEVRTQLNMKMGDFKPIWQEKWLGIKQMMLFAVRVKPLKTRDRISQEHFAREL